MLLTGARHLRRAAVTLCKHAGLAFGPVTRRDPSRVRAFAVQDWRQTLWSDIRTDVMEEGAKQFVKEVKSLHKKVRDEDVFRGVDSAVKNFLVSVPLVADLRSPAMRDRHWEQLMSTTKV